MNFLSRSPNSFIYLINNFGLLLTVNTVSGLACLPDRETLVKRRNNLARRQPTKPGGRNKKQDLGISGAVGRDAILASTGETYS